jgi:outer membrane scaffolding protein for murein synthesis (MipA/OmpV family)
MNKLLFLALAMGCAASRAETPAANPMPDGSRDMYAGLGVQSAPRYDGTGSRKVSALPTLQVEWSSGIFVSGMSAGMHLSGSPTLEYGPLLSVLPRRSESGTGAGADGVGQAGFAPMANFKGGQAGGNRLTGLEDVPTRVQGGAFLNYYLDPQWRLTSSLLYGSGRDRNGARLELGVQRLAVTLGDHHRVSLGAGLTAVNRNDNQTWFGVTGAEALQSRFTYYEPGGGLQDVHAGLRWNWLLTPSWMLTTHLEAKRLLGSASHSPLVERPSNMTVSTAVAYRF